MSVHECRGEGEEDSKVSGREVERCVTQKREKQTEDRAGDKERGGGSSRNVSKAGWEEVV